MLEKLETELKLRGFSEKTVSSYIFHNQKFLDFIKKQPDEIETDDIKQYIAHLMTKKLKPSSINLTICALRFYYEQVLEKDLKKIKAPKQEQKLPTVLTKDEIKQLIESAETKKSKLIISFLYSSGLRVSELVNLKIQDLNLDEKTGMVREGKGKKDRMFIIPERIVGDLKYFFNKHPNFQFVFSKEKPLTTRNIQKIVKNATKKAKLVWGGRSFVVDTTYLKPMIAGGARWRRVACV